MKTLPSMEATKYPIGAVSKLTGLSVDTLRMWERRYKLVTPERDGRGRLYSQDDIRRLQTLADAVAQGHSIGRLAALTTEAVEALLAGVSHRRPSPSAPAPVPSPPSAAGAIDRLQAAVLAFDAAGVERELGRLTVAMPVRDFVHRVVLPVMHWVGEEWHAGRLSVAQEHLLSSALRSLIGGLSRLTQAPPVNGRLLFATPAGDRHEFGVLAGAMLASAAGFGVIYLGTDLPASQIVEAAVRGQAEAVVIGHIHDDGRRHADEALAQVAAELPPHIELWIGGRIPPRLRLARPRTTWLSDFGALEAQFARLGGQL